MAKTDGSVEPAPAPKAASGAKRAAAGKAPTGKTAPPVKKAAGAKGPAGKKTAAVKKASTAEKASVAKAPVKKTAAKKAQAKKAPAPAKPAAGKASAPAKKAAAKKAPAKKASAQKASAKEAGAGKAGPAAAAKSPFPAKWLAAQEEALLQERATYVRQAENLQAEADALVADFESGDAQFDEDGGEGDTLSSERERDLTLSAQARAAVEEIDHALAKFSRGTYGICEASGDPIPRERLEAIPWARVQVQYKTGGLGRP